MSGDKWDKNVDRILSEIAKLRDDNESMRTKLQTEYSAESTKLRMNTASSNSILREANKTERSKLKDEYDEKYASELDKLRSNSAFRKSSTKKRKS